MSPLGLVEIAGVENREARRRQRGAQLALEEAPDDPRLGAQLGPAGDELLARRHAVGARYPLLLLDLTPQPAHALHRELVVDHSHDPGELDPLEQRLGRVLRQREDPAREGEPGELAVDVGRGGIDRGENLFGHGTYHPIKRNKAAASRSSAVPPRLHRGCGRGAQRATSMSHGRPTTR